MKKKIAIGGALVALQLVFVGLYLWGRSDPPKTSGTVSSVVERRLDETRHEPAPELTYETFDGESHRLSDLRGKTVVLHFWATWCPPCVEELPALLARADGADAVLLAIAVDDERAALAAFFEGEVPASIVLADASQVTRGYDVSELPQTMLVDAKGQLRARWLGARDWTPQEWQRLLAARSAR